MKKIGLVLYFICFVAFLHAQDYGNSFSGVTNISSSLLKEDEKIEFNYCFVINKGRSGEATSSLLLANDKLNTSSSCLDDSDEGLRAVQLFLDYQYCRDGFVINKKYMEGYLVIDYQKYALQIKDFEPFVFTSSNFTLNIPAIVKNGKESGEILISYQGKAEEKTYLDLWDDSRNSKTNDQVKLMKERMKNRAELHAKKTYENNDDGYKYVKMLTDDFELGLDLKEDYAYLTSLKDAVQIVFICSKEYGKTKYTCVGGISSNSEWEETQPYSYWEWADGLIRREIPRSEKKHVEYDKHFKKKITKYYVKYMSGAYEK